MPRSTHAALLFAALLLAASMAQPRPAAATTPAEAKMPMTVTLVRGDAPGCGAGCPEWLALTGVIGPGTPALFSAALARLGPRNVPVLVDSPGGDVQAAMAIGRAIRTRRMAVVVAGTGLDDCAAADRGCAARRRAGERPGFVAGGVAVCASACALILASGAERSVGENSYVGVHQMILRQTLTRVVNTFRILRRMVDGHPVEVSRMLVATRPVSTRQLQRSAPEALYSEVDRYLLGLGIAESIMPLMRSAPPNGVHWMTPAELASTRIATDTTDARTLVERSAEPAAPASQGRMAVASMALGGGPRSAGIVDWRVEGDAGAPALVGTVDVPDRALHGTLTIRRDTAPGAGGGFSASADFPWAAADGAGRAWTFGAPLLCDPGTCSEPFAPAGPGDPPSTARYRVPAAWGDGLLSALRDRDRVTFPLSAGDGSKGWLSLPLDGGARTVVADWERRCCGLAASTPTISGPSRATLASASSPAAASSPTDGTVRWQFGAGTSAGAAPALVGDVDVPKLAATVALTLGAPGSGPDALTLALRLGERAAAVTAGPLGFRETRGGEDRALGGSIAHGLGSATLVVPAADRGVALDGLRGRPWLSLPVRIEGREPFVLLLNLNGGGRPAIDAWLAREAGDGTSGEAGP